jgi:hypothetical protein
LFSDTDAPWNAMMAAAIIYVLPPIALLFALRRYVVAGLTMAGHGIAYSNCVVLASGEFRWWPYNHHSESRGRSDLKPVF